MPIPSKLPPEARKQATIRLLALLKDLSAQADYAVSSRDHRRIAELRPKIARVVKNLRRMTTTASVDSDRGSTAPPVTASTAAKPSHTGEDSRPSESVSKGKDLLNLQSTVDQQVYSHESIAPSLDDSRRKVANPEIASPVTVERSTSLSSNKAVSANKVAEEPINMPTPPTETQDATIDNLWDIMSIRLHEMEKKRQDATSE